MNAGGTRTYILTHVHSYTHTHRQLHAYMNEQIRISEANIREKRRETREERRRDCYRCVLWCACSVFCFFVPFTPPVELPQPVVHNKGLDVRFLVGEGRRKQQARTRK